MKYCILSASVLFSACSSPAPLAKVDATRMEAFKATRGLAQVPEAFSTDSILWDFKPGEITKLCGDFVATTDERLNKIAEVAPAQRSYKTTLLPLEEALADFGQMISPLVFMLDVHTNEKIREESNACLKVVNDFSVKVGTRRDLYNAIKDVKVTGPEETRLKSETVKGFEHSGLNLSDAKLAQFKKLQENLNRIGTDFDNNINDDKSSMKLTTLQLAGAPDSFLQRLPRDGDHYVVTAKGPDYVAVMENVNDADTRRKMVILYSNRAAAINGPILKEMIKIRQEIAALMGYPTWADYQTAIGRMAKSGPEVWTFINSLKGKLKEGNQKDLKILSDFKNKVGPKDGPFRPWDIAYYANQYMKQNFQIDTEKVREYFPSDFVVNKMFEVYSTLLGVRFEKMKNASVWSPDVSQYKIIDAKSNKLVGYFYADFIPREGKFTHAAAAPVRSGRRLADGTYLPPISVIMANFNPPSGNKPSLLSHDEVSTLFHEFGHIMHQTLTKVPFASLSGSAVARDFVEAPSQMLENWVWSPAILSRLSGHYKNPKQKLPADLLKRMIAARDFQISATNTRQLLYATIDMAYHSNPGDIDTSAVQQKLYKDIIGLDPVKESHMEASWGHLNGYDAGYYSYLWAEVYATDMFTIFEKGGLLSPKVGTHYRRTILEQGGMKDASVIVREFLGREPSSAPFYKRLGIQP